MNRDIQRRLGKLELKLGKGDLSRLSDNELNERIAICEKSLEQDLGGTWEADYRAYLLENDPWLVAAWDRRRNEDLECVPRVLQ